MYDKELILAILIQIENAINTIADRFKPVTDVSDFTNTQRGMEILDSICMQFIAIGESLKKIDKITSATLLPNYPDIDWKGIKGFRDIISHNYFDIDAEQVFWICDNELDKLVKTIRRIILDIQQ